MGNAKRRTLWLCLIIGSATAVAQLTAVGIDFEVAEARGLSRTVALVEGSTSDKGAPILAFECSGFLLDGRTVLTAAHCIDENERTVTIASGSGDLCERASWNRHEFRVIERDSEKDLAVLQSVRQIASDDRIAAAPLLPEDLHVVGWQQLSRIEPIRCEPSSTELTSCSSGNSFIICEFNDDQHVCGGLSGAGVLTATGELVGVLSASRGCAGGDAIIAPLSEFGR